MRWRRLGRVFCSEGQHAWMTTHAQTPFAERIDGGLHRIYFTARDAANRSHVGWLELDIARPDRVLRLCREPLLAPGAAGAFDDAGAMMSCVVCDGDMRHFFYTGWSVRTSVPYHLAIGAANGPRAGENPIANKLPGPVVERSPADPLFCASPAVLLEGGLWRMWYVSAVGWPVVRGRITPSYDIRYGESDDGIEWRRSGRVALKLERDEVGFSRPCVVRDGQAYVMWCSVRAQDGGYRLTCARSADGRDWIRDDAHAQLEPSTGAWDAEMVAYPQVFTHGDDQYLLYCGNGYGRAGFGLARLG